MRTFQTRIDLKEGKDQVLDQYADLLSRVERSLFTDLQRGQSSVAELKSSYLPRYGITARQFNSCHASIAGKIASLKELQKLRIADLEEKEKRVKKKLESKRFKGSRHQLHQSLQRTQGQLRKIVADKGNGIVRLCFGSRKLFMEQYHLSENQLNSHAEWKDKWQRKRNANFFLIGSKDETGGNQSCTGKIALDDSLTFRLRLPDGLNCGKYLTIEGVRFNYGHKEIVQAIERNSFSKQGVAISYRLLRDEKGWRIFVSIEEQKPEYATNASFGYIGVDLNVDHIAVAETDKCGNCIYKDSYPLNLYGKTQHQAEALIGDVVKEIVNDAFTKKKPLVIEKLNFVDKKRLLREMSPKQARMLSSFAYSRLITGIKAKAYRSRVEVFEVNPAYTSLIGKIKFAKRYGLSIHHAAALSIARRKAGFSETLPLHSAIPDGRGGYVAFAVPVRKQQRFSWQHLGIVSKKLRVALAAHFRVAKGQSIEAFASMRR